MMGNVQNVKAISLGWLLTTVDEGEPMDLPRRMPPSTPFSRVHTINCPPHRLPMSPTFCKRFQLVASVEV